MSRWSIPLIVLLVLGSLTSLAIGGATAQEGDGQGQGPDGEGPPKGPPEERGQGANTSQERRTEREQAMAERQEDRRGAWKEAIESRLGRLEDDRRAALIERLSPEMRERIGLLVPSETGSYDGNFVSFLPDHRLGLLQDVRVDDVVLFDEVYAPLAVGDEAAMEVRGQSFHVGGADWSFRLTDHPTAPMRFAAAQDAPFLLVLPTGASATATDYGMQIHYATPDAGVREARLIGAIAPDVADPTTLLVTGQAVFHVPNERVLLPHVANQQRAELDDAVAARHLGAETTVLRTGDASIFDETVFYEEMELTLDAGTAHSTEDAIGYTLTVDSESHAGKTVALNLESGLLDPTDLTFRYYNVEEDRVVAAPIEKATSLVDVLDPLDDGTVAEYWVIEDEDGVQILLSFPHFSIHQVEMMSFIDVVVEHPSLVAGALGAAALVSVGAIGMFRRPEDRL